MVPKNNTLSSSGTHILQQLNLNQEWNVRRIWEWGLPVNFGSGVYYFASLDACREFQE